VRNLKRWGWGVLLLMTSLWAAAAVAADEAPAKDCGLKQIASVEMTVGKFVLIPVTLNGTPAFMQLNIALPYSTLYPGPATELKLTLGKIPGQFSGASGVATIDSFGLGAATLRQVQLLVPSSDRQPTPGLPAFVGDISLPSMLKADFELDFAHNKLNFFATDHCPGKVVYWADSWAEIPYSIDKIGIPLFPIELDGKKISAALHLSTLGTTMKTDVSKLLYGFDEHSEGIRTDTTDSGKTINHYRAMKMTLPGVSVTNTDVMLLPGLAKSCQLSPRAGPEHSAIYQNCWGSAPLTLGLNVLKHLRLYFATQEHVLYVTAADATHESASVNDTKKN
jgi:hypothetical protein